MEESQRPAEDEFIESEAQHGWSREVALRKRWGRVARHKVLRQIFELLSQQPDRQMYLTEIAKALEVKIQWVRWEIQHFKSTSVVEVERRGQRTYYKLRPGMAEQYQQWLASQQPDEPEA
jgi:hypothetical protein